MKKVVDYGALNALNQTRLKQILKSPFHFKNYEGEESSGFNFGSKIHLAILEPLEAKKVFKLKPSHVWELRKGNKIEHVSLDSFDGASEVEFNSMSSRHRELLSSNLIWINDDELKAIKTISQQIEADPMACHWLTQCEKEKVITGVIDGVECKGLVDGLGSDFVMDLKTTDSILNFEKSVVKYGYDFQLAFYCMLANVHHAVIIAAENKAPYAVATFELSDEFLEIGKQKVLRAIKLYKECMQNNNWPSYTHSILQPPSWYLEIQQRKESH